MYRDLYSYEKKWLNKLLEVNFKGKQVILRQVMNAKVVRKEGYDFISLKFSVDKVEKYSYLVRVPVEMRVFQKDGAPILFLLHIINGYVDELEIFTADFSKLDISYIEISKVEYIINERVK